MNILRTSVRASLLSLLIAVSFLAFARPAQAADVINPTAGGVSPVRYEGNINTGADCPAGYNELFISTGQVLPLPGQKYDLGNGEYVIFTLTPPDTAGGINKLSRVSFVSTMPLDIVIIKGGNAYNAYSYNPPVLTDSGLVAPLNNGGNIPTVSHIAICTNAHESPQEPLEVSKDVNTSFTRTHNWDIKKSVSPDTLDLFEGQSGQVQWTVDVTSSGSTDSNYQISGTVTIHNPDTNTHDAKISSVTDVIDGAVITISCPSDAPAAAPYTLAPGTNLICTYTSDAKASASAFGITNTVTVETEGKVGGGKGEAPIIFTDVPSSEVNASVTITDLLKSDQPLGTLTAGNSNSFSYATTYTCNEDQGGHTNVASIVETGQTADAKATVNCYSLEVNKNANTSLTRRWNWTIDKTGNNESDDIVDLGSLSPAPNSVASVEYSVTIGATSEDNNWLVTGEISIVNPAPIVAAITNVEDVIDGDTPPAVVPDCKVEGVGTSISFPTELAPGGTIVCTYSANLPDAVNRINTATVSVKDSTKELTTTAAIDFSEATVTEVDKCVNFTDIHGAVVQFNETVCATDNFPGTTYHYTLNFGTAVGEGAVALKCGTNLHENIAKVVTVDTQTEVSDNVTVNVSVACGCTLTQGYWKTHGPTPTGNNSYDWPASVKSGGLTLGSKSYTAAQLLSILNKAPQGNGLISLAHQLIAAKINIANGAYGAGITATIAAADALIGVKIVPPVGSGTLSSGATSALVIALTAFNEGTNGGLYPPHCGGSVSANINGAQQFQQQMFMPVLINQE